MQQLERQQGFALIEVLIAIVVFAVGIMAVMSMQYRSMHQNSNANDRTRANGIALSVLEELKRLPFTNPNLTDANPAGNLFAGEAPVGGDPDPNLADHRFTLAALPVLANSYTVGGNNTIVDGARKSFQIFWNVQRTTITIGPDTFTPSCTIKLYMYWQGPLGQSHLEMTTVKYNNLSV